MASPSWIPDNFTILTPSQACGQNLVISSESIWKLPVSPSPINSLIQRQFVLSVALQSWQATEPTLSDVTEIGQVCRAYVKARKDAADARGMSWSYNKEGWGSAARTEVCMTHITRTLCSYTSHDQTQVLSGINGCCFCMRKKVGGCIFWIRSETTDI